MGNTLFFPDQPPWSLLWGRQGVSIVESACPEVLGKLMQILKNRTHRWLFPNKTFNYLSFGEVHWCSLSPHYFLWGCNFYFLSDNLFIFFFMRNPIEVRRRLGVGWAESPLWWLASWNIEWKFNLLLTFCNLLGDTSLGEGRGILRGRKVYTHSTQCSHRTNQFFHIRGEKLKVCIYTPFLAIQECWELFLQ